MVTRIPWALDEHRGKLNYLSAAGLPQSVQHLTAEREEEMKVLPLSYKRLDLRVAPMTT